MFSPAASGEARPQAETGTNDALPKLCPSASPRQWREGVIFGVVLGTPEQPMVKYLSEPQPASLEMLALSGTAEPDEVFRIAAPCAGRTCSHFNGTGCGLVTRVVQVLPVSVENLPSCRIRSQCQWWHQEAGNACLRCPQVVTLYSNWPEEYRSLANLEEDKNVQFDS